MRRRVGPAVNTVDSRDPPRRSLSIVSVTCYRVQTRLSCFEAHSGKSCTLLHVVTHVAPSVPRGTNHRKQASAARRREPPADARLFQTPPPPDLRCRVPCRNRSQPLARLRRSVSSSTCHRALFMV